MSRKSLKRIARGKALGTILVVVGIVVAEVMGFILVMLLNITDSIMAQAIPEGFGAAAAVLGVVLLGGSKMLKPSLKDVAHAFRFGWWCLAVTFALLGFDLIIYISEGTAVNTHWLSAVFKLAVFCLFIGIFEEFLFRGVVFQTLLGLMGETHRGVVRAVLVTSVVFGFAHVSTEDFGNALSVVQAVLKIVQTGLYSVLLCTIVLHTRRLGGVSLFHAVDDFVIVTPGIAFFNESIDIDYVVQGDDALPTIMYYLLVIALYIPFVIKSFREIKREQYVYRGAFMEDAVEEFRLAEQRALRNAEGEAQEAEAQVAREAQGASSSAHVPTPDSDVPSTYVPIPDSSTPGTYVPSVCVPDAGRSAAQPPVAFTPSEHEPSEHTGRPPVPKGL